MADQGGDIQTDAISEAPCMHHNEEEVPHNLGVFVKDSSQPGVAGVTNQSETVKAGSIVNDTSLPISSKQSDCIKQNDCMDILILHASDDYDSAKQMKVQIEKNKFYSGKFEPKVTLYDDFLQNHEFNRFDNAIDKTVYIFIYLTKLFCDNNMNLHQGHSCLTRLLSSEDSAQRVLIPVHTLPVNSRDYKTPDLLGGLRTLNFFSKSFDNNVTNLLEYKKPVIVERRMKNNQISEKKSDNNLQQSTFSKIDYINPVQKVKDNAQNMILAATQSSISCEQTSSKSQDQPKTRNACTEDQMSSVRTNAASFAGNLPENALDQDKLPEKVSDSFNMIALEKNCCSSAEKTSTISFRSSSEPEGDKAVPFNEPSHTSYIQTQEDFSARQVIADPITRGHHAVDVDSENPSGGSQDIQNDNISGAHESSFLVSNNRDTLPEVQVSNTLNNGFVRVDLSQIANRSSGQVFNIIINATNVAYGQHAVMNNNAPPIQQDPEDNSDSYDEKS